MKKRIFTLVAIFVAFFSLNASAYYGNAELVLSTWDRSVFLMVIDGQTYDSHLSSYHVSLTPGSHHLEVYTYRSHGSLSMCLFNSSIHLSQGVTTAMITSNGGFHKMSHSSPHNNYYGNGYSGNNHYGNTYGSGHNNSNYGHNGYYNNGYGSSSYGNNGYYGGHNNHSYNYGMSHAEYSNLKRMLKNTSFDSSRLKIAQSAVISGVSSKQVLGICRLFSFESSRVEFAKFAYSYTVDKNRYYIVNDAFTFSSSVDELSAYIYGY